MRIRNMQEVENFQSLIGDQNVMACERALKDGAEVWVFKTEEEIDASELTQEEKEDCKKILRDEKLGYAGWFRAPKKEVPGFTPSVHYDSHGNARGGRRGSGHESIH